MFLRKKRQNERRGTIDRLYGAIVAQARNPVFYARLGVPDTVEGRFDLLVLHLFLVNERLAEMGEAGKILGQEMLDRFFEDMDGSLREIGIGDLSVPKKMRSLAEAYLGRSAAYQAALAADDRAGLAAAIARNIYGKEAAPDASTVARYTMETKRVLAAMAAAALFAGEIAYPIPERFVADEG